MSNMIPLETIIELNKVINRLKKNIRSYKLKKWEEWFRIDVRNILFDIITGHTSIEDYYFIKYIINKLVN